MDHTDVTFTCDCKHVADCEHVQVVMVHLPDVVAMDTLSTLNPLAFLVAATKNKESFVFSVSATSQVIVGGGKHTMVYLLRDGSWRCQSDGRSGQCHHVGYAKTLK